MADARLTPPSYLVLGIIDKLGEASPYDVKVEAARTVAPFWTRPHAQVYTQCDRLVETGLPLSALSGHRIAAAAAAE